MKPDRRNWLKQIGLFITGISFSDLNVFATSKNHSVNQQAKAFSVLASPKSNNMKLGAFSISLNVKDINASKQFYEKLGFTVFGGDISKNYLIMKNGNSLVGLFHGMFENNILTFNPGWDENAQKLPEFDDIRSIQKDLKKKGIQFVTEADENSSGPASFILTDPDGNTIYIDQHI